jgi:predicted nuclease of predicted toxin-antitoxin system
MNVFFDENFSEYLAEALNLLEKTDGKLEVYSTKTALYRSAPDDEIVRFVAANGGVLFSKDSDFRKAQLITDLMKEHHIGLFYFKTPRKEVYWDTVVTIIRAFQKCREFILTMEAPYCFEILHGGGVKARPL